MNNYLNIVNEAIEADLCKKNYYLDDTLAEAIRYAVLANGKRMRPQFLLRFLNDLTNDYREGINYALALEYVHNYSLIHDDLPAMDNDDYRRGNLTVHKKFNEAIAVLAGDNLLTYAFELVNEKPSVIASKCSKILSINSGYHGMIGGQLLDISYNPEKDSNLESIQNLVYHKTGNLIVCALQMAAVIANREDLLDDLQVIGFKLGEAFQIQDDIFDAKEDKEEDRPNFVTLLGEQEAKKRFMSLYNEVISFFENIKKDSDTKNLIESLMNRKY